MFGAAGGGAFIAPAFVLSNPYTAGNYNGVSRATTALDSAVTQVSKQPGPQGSTGAAGSEGPAGTDGKNTTGGTSTDPLAVHYDSASLTAITLWGANGTQFSDLAAGTVGSDGVDVDQLQ